MNRPWLDPYPAGVPAEIDIHQFSSLKDVLATSCARFADLPAYNAMGTVMPFRQLDDASRAFAAWLQTVAGLQRGDRVALMMPNRLQYPVALENFAHTLEQVLAATPLRTVVTTQFPHAIEDALTMHPGVLEAAAINVPDKRSGEVVKIVVMRQDHALTEGELLAHCKLHLTGYKMPRIVEFRAEPLPKSNIGKILRRELRGGGAASPAASAPVAPA